LIPGFSGAADTGTRFYGGLGLAAAFTSSRGQAHARMDSGASAQTPARGGPGNSADPWLRRMEANYERDRAALAKEAQSAPARSGAYVIDPGEMNRTRRMLHELIKDDLLRRDL
jgi:hypothetical protein